MNCLILSSNPNTQHCKLQRVKRWLKNSKQSTMSSKPKIKIYKTRKQRNLVLNTRKICSDDSSSLKNALPLATPSKKVPTKIVPAVKAAKKPNVAKTRKTTPKIRRLAKSNTNLQQAKNDLPKQSKVAALSLVTLPSYSYCPELPEAQQISNLVNKDNHSSSMSHISEMESPGECSLDDLPPDAMYLPKRYILTCKKCTKAQKTECKHVYGCHKNSRKNNDNNSSLSSDKDCFELALGEQFKKVVHLEPDATFTVSSGDETPPTKEFKRMDIPLLRQMPVIITSPKPISELKSQLDAALGASNYTAVSTQNGTRVCCVNDSTVNKLSSFLRSSDLEFYSHQPPTDRGCRIFIKYLYVPPPLHWIRSDLHELGYKVRFIEHMSKDSVNTFKAEIEAGLFTETIFELSTLGKRRVKIEPLNRHLEIPQCHRCQQLGHTRHYCARQHTCVKCAGKHPSAECVKPIEEKPTCANCGGDHTANYRGCIAYKNALQLRLSTQHRN